MQHLDFSQKRIVILGLARQGLALARFFVGQNARVTVSDMAPAEKLERELAALEDLPVTLALGGHPAALLEDCDLLCLSGGVPPQIELVQTAIARGIPLSNDSLLTLQLARQRGLSPVLAVTGSSGKTTTTTLVGLILQAGGNRVHVGGNIGTPLIDRLDEIEPGDAIVLELSSFQLELFDPALAYGLLEGIGPDVAAMLNVTPNHLDRHPSMAAYAAAKFNLLRTLPPAATVVLNADDAVTGQVASCGSQITPPPLPATWQLKPAVKTAQSFLGQRSAAIVCFSREHVLKAGAWLEDDNLVYNGKSLCRRDAVRLRGEHNLSNLLAAAAISGAVGAPIIAMRQVATTFMGVPHRLETVATVGNVLWINDSIATSPERALAALRAFAQGAQTLILLVGGKDKNLPWQAFADEALQRVNILIGFGAAGAMIVNTVQERARFQQQPPPSCAVVQRLDEAVELAARAAMGHQRPDDPIAQSEQVVILLSPGGASYDAYKDFEARGEHFRRLVAKWTARNMELGSRE